MRVGTVSPPLTCSAIYIRAFKSLHTRLYYRRGTAHPRYGSRQGGVPPLSPAIAHAHAANLPASEDELFSMQPQNLGERSRPEEERALSGSGREDLDDAVQLYL